MRSGTSFFNGTIYRKTLTRFWPLWAVNLAIWLIIMPLSGLITLSSCLDDGDMSALIRFGSRIGDQALDVGIIFALIAGLGVAMAVCSHLYFHKAANFMGALPVRREGQFVSTYLAGLTMLIVPNAVVFLLTAAVEAAGGCLQWTPLLFWLGALCAMEFFFYSFAVCIGQFTGHLLALPVYYGVFNAVVYVILFLLDQLMDGLCFGYAGMGGLAVSLATWCTPVLLFVSVEFFRDFLENGTYAYEIENEHVLIVYAVLALVLVVCALLINRRRHMETAGDTVAVKVMRPVFKYGVAVCAGLCFGYLTAMMVDVETRVGLLVAMLVWAVIGYFVAQMLLEKSFRVLKKWKGAAVVAAVFLLFFGVVRFDLLGYSSYVPSADQVEEVTVNGLAGGVWDSGTALSGVVLADRDTIEDVIALHEKIVEYGWEGEIDSGDSYSRQISFYVSYTLNSGRVVERQYNLMAGDELLGLAQTLRDHEEVRRKAYQLDTYEPLFEQGFLRWAGYRGMERIEFSDIETLSRLWNAVMADFDAGRLGVADLRNDSYVDLELVGYERYLEFEFEYKHETQDYYISGHVEFYIPNTATETLTLLEELMSVDNRYQEDPGDNTPARE